MLRKRSKRRQQRGAGRQKTLEKMPTIDEQNESDQEITREVNSARLMAAQGYAERN